MRNRAGELQRLMYLAALPPDSAKRLCLSGAAILIYGVEAEPRRRVINGADR